MVAHALAIGETGEEIADDASATAEIWRGTEEIVFLGGNDAQGGSAALVIVEKGLEEFGDDPTAFELELLQRLGAEDQTGGEPLV